MVKKLIKYDFASYMRLILPVQLILIGIAALSRIVQIFEPSEYSVAYNIVFTSSIVLYSIAIVSAALITVIVAMVRFYQGMYTNEGYLSHTLPVTPSQHIFSKLTVSLVFEIMTFLAILVSGCVITFGDVNIELFKALFFLIRKFYTALGGHEIAYFFEFIIALIIAAAAKILKLYFCISVGQLAAKKKVLLAFGVYFGLYVVSQIIGTLIIIFSVVNEEFIESIAEWIVDNPIPSAHIFACSVIVISAALGLVYYLVTRYIMSKKLNLT